MTVRGLNGVTGPPAHKVVGLEQIPGHARVQRLLEVNLINVEAMQVNRDYAILSYAQLMVSLVSGLNGQLARRVVELAYGLEHVRVVHQRMVVLRVPDHVSKQKTAILKHVHL